LQSQMLRGVFMASLADAESIDRQSPAQYRLISIIRTFLRLALPVQTPVQLLQ